MRSYDVGAELTNLEVMSIVTIVQANEFRGRESAVGPPFPVLLVGQAERRRGPSELASAFLFPNCCLPVPLAAHLEVHLALCF